MYRITTPLILCFFTYLQTLIAQEGQTLSLEAYLQQVQANHPLARQIRLLGQRGEQEIRRAKGGLDPLIGTQFDHKTFDTKNYFSILNAYLKVPTGYGPELETGYSYTNGIYLNQENTLPSNGQMYLGVNVPLLQGFWTDERQVAVREANLVNQRNVQEIRLLLNDLLYEAAKAYWEWSQDYYEIILIEQSLGLAEQRHEATKQSFFQGDKPGIDTLEAFLVIQDRLLRLREARLHYQQSTFALNSFLWSANGQPQELAPTVYPTALEPDKIAALEETVLQQALFQTDSLHPALEWYRIEQERLEWERRLKSNKILPKLDLKYNWLAVDNFTFIDDVETASHNYKFGLKFSMPLFLRQPRADLELTKIKMQETRLKREDKMWELHNKVQAYFAEVQLYAEQNRLLEQMVENYSLLLQAEQQKFAIGESSIFLLNARELKLLESREKLLSTQVKYFKAQMGLNWVNAVLAQ